MKGVNDKIASFAIGSITESDKMNGGGIEGKDVVDFEDEFVRLIKIWRVMNFGRAFFPFLGSVFGVCGFLV